MKTVYVSIGNSDDRLSQAEWSRYWASVSNCVHNYADGVHGEWTSDTTDAYQNAIWGFDIDDDHIRPLKAELAERKVLYRQDSIAWTEAKKAKML